MYSEIKRKLIEDYGIPPSEIRFIQECKNERARKSVIAAMNAGTVRVLFGSTSMLGTGVNVQQRCVAIHHLDTPWRPSDLAQRDGRGVRAGNEIAKLYADNRFVVEDNYKYQYNYGHIAKSDPIAVANNFLNTLQKIPSYIEQYESRCKALEKEIPQLLEIVGKTWKKEDELKDLKNGAGGIGQKDTVGAGAATGSVKGRNGTRKSKAIRDTYSSHATLIHYYI